MAANPRIRQDYDLSGSKLTVKVTNLAPERHHYSNPSDKFKTPLIRKLVESGHHYFLSRPRCFGKSLLVDTLKALFTGQETIFRGLDIHNRPGAVQICGTRSD